jgi:TPR repeat protein
VSSTGKGASSESFMAASRKDPANNVSFYERGRSFVVGPLRALLFILLSSSAIAAESNSGRTPPSQVNDCDKQAGMNQLGFEEGSVLFDAIDAGLAIAACERAVRVLPNGRYLFQLGRAYAKYGDLKKALDQYQLATDQWYLPAINAIGLMFEQGNGMPKNLDKAFAWYLKAAEHGYGPSQAYIGLMYWTGEGKELNYETAYSWFLKAANQGFPSAQFAIGCLFADGQGVAKNYRTAFTWFWKAAQQGMPAAQNKLGRFYANGLGINRDSSLAATWFYKAASQGDSDAQFSLASLLEKGIGVSTDIDQAIFWYEKSAAQGNADAVLALPKAKSAKSVLARLASYILSTGKKYTFVKSRGIPGVPGSIVCKDNDTTSLLSKIYVQYIMDSFIQPFTNGEQSQLLHGKTLPPTEPDFEAYGCVFAKVGTPMYMEVGNVVPVVVLISDDGSIYRGVTVLASLQQ